MAMSCLGVKACGPWKQRMFLVASALGVLALGSEALAATLVVRPVPGPGEFATINAAMAAASAGDLISVQSATYVENVAWNKDVNILCVGAVTIRSASSSATEVISVTGTGSRLLTSDSVSNRLTIAPHASATNQRGLDCSAAQAISLAFCDFSGFDTSGKGAAIHNTSGTIGSCTFTSCSAGTDGGAICGTGSTTVSDCTFSLCTAGDDGGAVFDVGDVTGCDFNICVASGDGGGVSGADNVTASTFDLCTAGTSGGAIHSVSGTIGGSGLNTVAIQPCDADDGGGIADSAADVVNCTIDDCFAWGLGGGGMNNVTGDIERCQITSCAAVSLVSGEGRGGGIRSSGGLISNCLILDNYAEGHGGGLNNCDGAIKCNTILDNLSNDLGGGLRGCGGTIVNNIIRGNEDSHGGGTNSDQMNTCSNPSYSCMESGWSGGGSNNTTNDPQFVSKSGTNPLAWDLHLQLGSVCINTGTTANNVTHDFDGASRPVNTFWDMGAFEKQ